MPLSITQNVFGGNCGLEKNAGLLVGAAIARGGDHAHLRGSRAPVMGEVQEN